LVFPVVRRQYPQQQALAVVGVAVQAVVPQALVEAVVDKVVLRLEVLPLRLQAAC